MDDYDQAGDTCQAPPSVQINALDALRVLLDDRQE
jgi:hypothetical protein